MQRWQDDGEHIDDKGCQKAWKYLNTKRMVPDINQREMKEDVCRLEVVKREFIKEPSTCVINIMKANGSMTNILLSFAIASSFFHNRNTHVQMEQVILCLVSHQSVIFLCNKVNGSHAVAMLQIIILCGLRQS